VPEPKRLPPDSIPAALKRAAHYRLLGEPQEAESICCDVLAVDPDHQEALITLLLALTDQFAGSVQSDLEPLRDVAPRLNTPYEQEYYTGIVHERWGKAQLSKGIPAESAAAWLHKAMRHYEAAAELARAGDPDATLRWNACARLLKRLQPQQAEPESVSHDIMAEFGDDVPPRYPTQ